MNQDTLTRILDLARWAPSGDNTQPWRFEIVNGQTVRVHGHDTRDHILYDFRGHPSHIAHGALLETIRIAATGFGLSAHWHIHSVDAEERQPVYEVRLTPLEGLATDPLVGCIEKRTVQRRPMQTTPLTPTQRQAVTSAGGADFEVRLFESLLERRQVAKLLWGSARIRLTCPEAYPVHKHIIEWRTRYSKNRIPEQAVGVDPLTARLMEWVMQSWGRVDFFNRYLMGTVAPRIQLDYLPAICCAAHLLVRPHSNPTDLTDWLRLGAAVQRIWLTATQQGLHLQPQMTPVIFRWYARTGARFSPQTGESLQDDALRLSEQFEQLVRASSSSSFGFFARIGISQPPRSRSIREDLPELMLPKASALR